MDGMILRTIGTCNTHNPYLESFFNATRSKFYIRPLGFQNSDFNLQGFQSKHPKAFLLITARFPKNSL